jgi:hypothetical protein
LFPQGIASRYFRLRDTDAIGLCGFLLSLCTFFTFPAVGIIGRVAIIEARSVGWVLIGPVVNLSLGILDNPFVQKSRGSRPDNLSASRRNRRYPQGIRCLDRLSLAFDIIPEAASHFAYSVGPPLERNSARPISLP